MNICKMPTQRLKELNKHITRIMYIEMENVISNLTKPNTWCRHQQGFKHNYVQDIHTACPSACLCLFLGLSVSVLPLVCLSLGLSVSAPRLVCHSACLCLTWACLYLSLGLSVSVPRLVCPSACLCLTSACLYLSLGFSVPIPRLDPLFFSDNSLDGCERLGAKAGVCSWGTRGVHVLTV